MKILINTINGAVYNMNFMVNLLPIKHYSGKFNFTIYFSNNHTITISSKSKIECECIRKDIETFLTDGRKKLELK